MGRHVTSIWSNSLDAGKSRYFEPSISEVAVNTSAGNQSMGNQETAIALCWGAVAVTRSFTKWPCVRGAHTQRRRGFLLMKKTESWGGGEEVRRRLMAEAAERRIVQNAVIAGPPGINGVWYKW